MRTPIAASIACLFVAAAPAWAISYRSYQHREIVVAADMVVEAKIVSIIDPPELKDDEKPGYSVAKVRIERVFKGDVKPGTELAFVFWSRAGRGKYEDYWRSPDQYKVGETLMLALRKHNEGRFKGVTAPREIATAQWSNWSPRNIYGKQIESAEFRRVAELWIEPRKHVDDPKRRDDAVYFLAIQKRLSEKSLVELLQSNDLGDQHAGCLAAGVMKTNAAVAPLVALIEKHCAVRNFSPEGSYTGDRKKLEAAYQVYQGAGHALHVTPFDGDKDGLALLRLARCGEMSESLVERLLLAGQARWHVRRGLSSDDPRASVSESLAVLHALDARAAYEPIKHYAERSEGSLHVAHLLRGYQTLWAQRFALQYARELTSGHGVTEEFYVVRGAFHFTHGPVESKAKGWEAAYEELRKNAEKQLVLTEKLGPNFSELRARLDLAEKWVVHRVGQSKPVELTKSKRAKLVNLVVAHADAKAKNLDAKAEAGWFVDLYYPAYSHSPVGQLWVADDGTFGLGWIPDRAWGKSASIAGFLAGVSPR